MHPSLCIYQGTHLCLLNEEKSDSVGFPLDLVSTLFDSQMTIGTPTSPTSPTRNTTPAFLKKTNDLNRKESVSSRYEGDVLFHSIGTNSPLIQRPSQGSATSLHLVQVSTEDSNDTSCTVSIHAHKDEQGSFKICKYNANVPENYNDDHVLLHITGAMGGYLDAEFRDTQGGCDQILFLPQWDPMFEYSIRAKEDPMGVLQLYLEHCIMMDGSNVLYCGDHVKIERKHDGTRDSVLIALGRVVTTPHNNTSQKRKRSSTMDEEGFISIQRVDRETETSTKPTKSTTSEKPWQTTFRKGLEQQLQHVIQRQRQKQNIQIVQNQLLEQSQQVLTQLSIMDHRKSYDQSIPLLEMVRSRYLVESSHIPNENGLGVQIHLEVDVYYKLTKPSTSNDLHQILDVQLSAVPDGEMNGDTLKIHTSSCLVPTWNQGDCFRLSALLHITEMEVPDGKHFCFHLSTFFRHPDTNTEINDLERTTKMTGCLLGSISIPVEDLLLFRNDGSFKHIQSSTMDLPIYPIAHFDYREPKTILVDTSTAYSSFSGREWQDLSDWINQKCAPRCRIDVIVDSAQSKVQLSMFAPSPKERSALISLVYEKLPDDVVIMGETNSITEEYARSSFLQAAKAELKLLHKCANKPKGTLTQMDVANIFTAQSITDEALARIHEQTSIT